MKLIAQKLIKFFREIYFRTSHRPGLQKWWLMLSVVFVQLVGYQSTTKVGIVCKTQFSEKTKQGRTSQKTKESGRTMGKELRSKEQNQGSQKVYGYHSIPQQGMDTKIC